MGVISWFQVFHQKTFRIYVIILAVHYVVSLLDIDTDFPLPYVNMIFRI